MEKTDTDKIVAANFPDLEEHAKLVEALLQIGRDIKTEQAHYRNRIKPHLEERRDLLKDARKAGVDTKALKQLAKVVDFMDKEVINVHDKIGEDAGDTAQAMFDQFALPFGGFKPGKDLISEARRKNAEAKKKKEDKVDKAKAANNSGGKSSLKEAAAKTHSGQQAAKE